VDATQNGEPRSYIWLLQADGRWRYLAVGWTRGTVDSQPDPASKWDDTVPQFLAATRSRDCPTMYRLLDASSRYIENVSQADFCRDTEAAFDKPNYFYSDVLKDRDAQARPIGKTGLNGFYEIRVNGTDWVIVTTTTPNNRSQQELQGHAPDGILGIYPTSYSPAS
jgi:hypothetical protein